MAHVARASARSCQAASINRRLITGLLIAALAVLVIAAQLVLPGIGEGQIEDRLTENGGVATAELGAMPAVRLLWGDGDSLEVRGSGLDLDLTENPEVFDRLDGFGEVDVSLSDFRAGPFDVTSFELVRDGDGPYTVRSTSSTTAAELVDFGVDSLGLPGGGLLGAFAAGATTDRPIPVALDMEMESDDGRVRVVSGGGTVAGYPTGPLAELITSAIVVRL
jgi:hypothetical protein